MSTYSGQCQVRWVEQKYFKILLKMCQKSVVYMSYMNENKGKEKAALMPHLMILLSKFCHKQFCIMSIFTGLLILFSRVLHVAMPYQRSLSGAYSLSGIFCCLFDDTVTKPCPRDELCNSKVETEKRNDHFSYRLPGYYLLRFPQWNLEVLLLYSWITCSCWPYCCWGQPAPCFVTWEYLRQKAWIF